MAPLERDLQKHLAELSGQVKKIPGKVSNIVEESFKYLQHVHSKDAINGRIEFKMLEKALSMLKDQMKAIDTGAGEMVEDSIRMETGLTECATLVEAVTGRRQKIKERLADLLHKLGREESISRRILDEVSVTRKLGSLSQVESMVRTMVMQDLNTTNHVMVDQRQISPLASPTRQVFTKPLPSIRQLPTLPLPAMVAGTLHQQGGMTPAAQNRGGWGEQRDFVRSCKSVRGGLSGLVMRDK